MIRAVSEGRLLSPLLHVDMNVGERSIRSWSSWPWQSACWVARSCSRGPASWLCVDRAAATGPPGKSPVYHSFRTMRLLGHLADESDVRAERR